MNTEESSGHKRAQQEDTVRLEEVIRLRTLGAVTPNIQQGDLRFAARIRRIVADEAPSLRFPLDVPLCLLGRTLLRRVTTMNGERKGKGRKMYVCRRKDVIWRRDISLV